MKKFINKDEDFMFTYGDGVSNVNLKKLISFHKRNKKMITVTQCDHQQDLVKLR